jgi:hypothetical protein
MSRVALIPLCYGRLGRTFGLCLGLWLRSRKVRSCQRSSRVCLSSLYSLLNHPHAVKAALTILRWGLTSGKHPMFPEIPAALASLSVPVSPPCRMLTAQDHVLCFRRDDAGLHLATYPKLSRAVGKEVRVSGADGIFKYLSSQKSPILGASWESNSFFPLASISESYS